MSIMRARLRKGKKSTQISVVPTGWTTGLVGMDTMQLLSKMDDGNKLVIVITDIRSKLSRAILTTKNTAKQIVTILLGQ